MASEVDNIIDGLPAHWERTTLGAICERGGGLVQTGPFGSQLHAADYVAVGIPSIMPVNIENFRVTEQGIERVAQADAERLSRHLVRPGDIVFSRRGDVERHALIRESERGWMCGTGCVLVRMGDKWKRDETPVLPEFASYWLRHPDVRGWIVAHAVGSTMPNLNTSIMAAIPFAVPPLPEQRAIARVLGGLDDKIELNRRMNRTLEDLARGVFRSWFVDFDPVLRPAPGPPSRPPSPPPVPPARRGGPASPAPRSAPAAPAPPHAPWPTRLTDSPLGPIPEGWRVTLAGELAEFVLGGDWGKDSATEGELQPAYCIRGADIPSLQAGGRGKMPIRYLEQSSLNKRALRPGDLVVEISGGSPTQSTGRPVLVGKPLLGKLAHPLVCSNFCRIFRPKANLSTYAYLWLRWLYEDDVFLQYENGTTGIKNFAFTIFCERQHVLIPPDHVLAAFAGFVDPMFEIIGQNGIQADTLAALRDALLPQLLSGEIRLREADRAVDDALRSTGTSTPPERPARPGAGTVHAGAKGRA